jgi:prepilin peptidase CpaA
MSILLLTALSPILVAVAIKDLSELRIPNALVLFTMMIFAVTCWWLPLAELADRFLAAAITFGLLLLLFAGRLVGGGDVKMLPALVLFVPPSHWTEFGALLSAALVVGVIGIGVARAAISGGGPSGWLALDRPRTFPMGVSIALSGLALTGMLLVQNG